MKKRIHVRHFAAVLSVTVVAVLLLGVTRKSTAQHDHSTHARSDQAPTALVLPEHLRTILTAEMRLLASGMGALLVDLSKGETDRATSVARQIRDSFILKQQLSPEELGDLVSLLPDGFIAIDKSFHADADEIVKAASAGDFALAIRHYASMSQACVSCHTTYASDRFPRLIRTAGEKD